LVRDRATDTFLVPEIDRQQTSGLRVAFRADAAFARPEIYEALEARGVQYAIRIPANKNLELAIELFGSMLRRIWALPVCRPADRRAWPETVGEERAEGGRSVRKECRGSCRVTIGAAGRVFRCEIDTGVNPDRNALCLV
jgi:hypothetical protein